MKEMEMGEEETANHENTETPEDYEIKQWVDCILEAASIKADARKMKYVTPELQKRKSGIDEVLGGGEKISSMKALKAKANKM